MLGYEKFLEMMVHLLPSYSEALSNYEYEIVHVSKLQQGSYDGIGVRFNDNKMQLDLTPFYQRYLNDHSMDEVLSHLEKRILNAMANAPTNLLPNLNDYEAMKVHLVIQLNNYQMNHDILHTYAHLIIGDIACTYRFILEETEDEVSSILITKEMLASYGITLEQLHQDALQAMLNSHPHILFQLDDIVEQSQGTGIFVLTTHQHHYGASCMMSKAILDDVAERLLGSFFIIPCSIHEVLVTNEEIYEPRMLCEMLRSVNEDIINTGDFLSNSLYYYEAESHCLMLVLEDD